MTPSSQTMWPGSPTREHGPEARATRADSIFTTRILPAVLLVIFAAQCLWFVGTQSFTVDEPFNLAVGIKRWWGISNQGNDNPPLLRMLSAVPLLGSPAAEVAASEFELDQPVDPIAVAWRTRPVNVVLGLLLALALWRAARHYFSPAAANFALALFAFSPPLIAFFSIIGTDGIAALMIFVTALQVARFRREPTWSRALLTGVVLGLLLLAKLYTLPMFALALLLVVLPSPAHLRFWRWKWGKGLTVAAICFVLVWACYWFQVSDLVVRDHRVWVEHHGTLESPRLPVPTNLAFSLPLPAGDFAASILNQLQHGREGHEAYLLGSVSRSEHGWRYYFLVAVALKWPTVVLLLGAITAALVLLRRIRLPRDCTISFLFPISFFGVATLSTVNIGERYVLAVYPFLLLLVAALYEYVRQSPAGGGGRRSDDFASMNRSPGDAPGPTHIGEIQPEHTGTEHRFNSPLSGNPSGAKAQVYEAPEAARLKPCPSTETLGSLSGSKSLGSFSGLKSLGSFSGSKRRTLAALLMCAAALNAADVLRFAPDYLSYFTVFVPQARSWRYLSDSSLDWGQGLIALRKYERQHPGEEVHVAYFSNGIGPDRYGVQAIPFGEKERPRGTVVVSPGALSGQFNDEPEAYRWVLRYPLKAVIGHDLLVFDVR